MYIVSEIELIEWRQIYFQQLGDSKVKFFLIIFYIILGGGIFYYLLKSYYGIHYVANNWVKGGERR